MALAILATWPTKIRAREAQQCAAARHGIHRAGQCDAPIRMGDWYQGMVFREFYPIARNKLDFLAVSIAHRAPRTYIRTTAMSITTPAADPTASTFARLSTWQPVAFWPPLRCCWESACGKGPRRRNCATCGRRKRTRTATSSFT